MESIYYVIKDILDANGNPVLDRKEFLGPIIDEDIIDELEEINERAVAKGNKRLFCTAKFFDEDQIMSFPSFVGPKKWNVN